MIIGETFIELVKDPNHWLFEIMLMVIFDGLLAGILYPLFRRWLQAHDDKKHAHEHCEDAHPEPTIEELLQRVKDAQAHSEETMKRLNYLVEKSR